ncbi:MAG: hypothetical protein A3C30_05015 [Candidatus Levybacteria bacterium RIFCSPHIGHO2_02_FULL_40_18]|nr:MAG: hypothetical protein A2869_02675 [Candidatus Levybacteria bacterium RIFCSPHIGHO2_01_FULL_40_58]OGH26435.1 MAG: hypothetical protein A3C30_05015 [Candidatus Levybacteria bacterium RIFCSPHIGHO2_02_FULL_40_18]OGH31883.1 MAG: hypothetical protein A3E43_00815 [Candidatus Levybacteria bacterium RIFCSPHIGHO2_12_FULL_40_31]OGH40516.1 MAG: hypothetical protein A2894_01320 [Candidatus Levybacteria bacterium RIFCSPLOWO2_01_FULL_40_64]OGH53896.1 MAG: hypothetical protein A3G15_02030 [Candidatus Lev
MKKLIIVYVALIIAVILLAVFKAGGNLPSLIPFKGGAEAQVNNKKISLILAKSDKDRTKGLSGRNNLPEDQGMLFIFEKKGTYGFWMRDMKFPIDIIFIDDDMVVYIVENASPGAQTPNLTIYIPDVPVNRVLELNAGQVKKLGIKKGIKITFKGI